MAIMILVINPGAGSTKVALYRDEEPLFIEVIRHTPQELSRFQRTADQYDFREGMVIDSLEERGIALNELSAVVGRGGPFKPLASGTYRVNQTMLDDIVAGRVQADHPSNLGALIAHKIAQEIGVPSFIVDPVSVDEFPPVARISGLPELERKSLSHALNIKMVARKAAKDRRCRYIDLNMVVVHLGTGISVSAHRRGQMIDVNNANDGGPLSSQRAGGLPSTGLAKLCLSGKYTYEEMKDKITKTGGLLAYLGTDDLGEVERRIEENDEKAQLIFEAMVYQIGKEIGAMAAALRGDVDAIVLTGGMANSSKLTSGIAKMVKFIAPVLIYPGEDEMEALARGALRVLRGEEEAREY